MLSRPSGVPERNLSDKFYWLLNALEDDAYLFRSSAKVSTTKRNTDSGSLSEAS